MDQKIKYRKNNDSPCMQVHMKVSGSQWGKMLPGPQDFLLTALTAHKKSKQKKANKQKKNPVKAMRQVMTYINVEANFIFNTTIGHMAKLKVRQCASLW